MTRLVMMSNGQDDWLLDAQQVVAGEVPVWDEAKVVAELRARLPNAAGLEAIELISHSLAEPDADRNRLRIQQWTVRGDAFATAPDLRGLLSAVGSPPLYVVGCLTAEGAVAQATLRGLEQTLGVAVYGTRRMVGTFDLDADGALIGRQSLWARPRPSPSPPAPPVPYAVNGPALQEAGAEPRWFRPLDRSRLRELAPPTLQRKLTDALDLLQPNVYFYFPGLLTVPTQTVVSTHNGVTMRLDSLFVDRLLRVTLRGPRGRREYLFPVGSQRRVALRRVLTAR